MASETATPPPDDVRLLTGWGGTAPTAATVLHPTTTGAIRRALTSCSPRGAVARGLGRSYGDAAQNAGGTVVDMTAVPATWSVGADGILSASAACSVHELLAGLVPRGWFVPITPGTRFVTLGGAVAADIHGKNHHVDGSLAPHVRALTLMLATGETVRCTPTDNAELFRATLGGLGLTGIVTDVELALFPIASSRLLVDTDRAGDLDAALALLAEDGTHRYSVAWIDLSATGRRLGRSVVTRGDFATEPALGLDHHAPVRLTAPRLPAGALNRRTVQAFNEAWYRLAPSRARGEVQRIARFFHPLDAVGQWNRLYGRRGFVQWQPVVPLGAEEVLRTIVERLARSGHPSFLSVLKRFGPGNNCPLSFPIEGWTLALDLPAGSADLAVLLDELDQLVTGAGGRVYLAKDSRLRPELVPAMYPRLDEWRAVRDRADPQGRMHSDLSRRLRLC